MSFGGSSGRSSFGKKGFSGGQKKEKRRKQEFHKHKLKISTDQHLEFQELKERVTVALDKLGHQVFSIEPGGYTFDNWMTSLNLLLDDFEERSNPANLPRSYFEARQRLTSELLKPPEDSELDSSIDSLTTKINDLESKVLILMQEESSKHSKERQKTALVLERMKTEHSQILKDLKYAKTELEQRKMEKPSFFKKIFSNSGTSVSSVQGRISELESENNMMEKDIRKLQDDYDGSIHFHESEDIRKMKVDIEALRSELGELELKKREKTELSDKRIQITKEMSDVISAIHLETFKV